MNRKTDNLPPFVRDEHCGYVAVRFDDDKHAFARMAIHEDWKQVGEYVHKANAPLVEAGDFGEANPLSVHMRRLAECFVDDELSTGPDVIDPYQPVIGGRLFA